MTVEPVELRIRGYRAALSLCAAGVVVAAVATVLLFGDSLSPAYAFTMFGTVIASQSWAQLRSRLVLDSDGICLRGIGYDRLVRWPDIEKLVKVKAGWTVIHRAQPLRQLRWALDRKVLGRRQRPITKLLIGPFVEDPRSGPFAEALAEFRPDICHYVER